jgi:hypothetical protein
MPLDTSGFPMRERPMPPSAPLTAVTTVTATAVLASLLAAPSHRPPVLHGASDTSIIAGDHRGEGDGSLRSIADSDTDTFERLPLNGDRTATATTPVPIASGGTGWTTFPRKSKRTVTVAGVGSVPANAFGVSLKVTGRWTTKKDPGWLVVNDPELPGDYQIVESPYGTTYESSELMEMTLSEAGTIEVANNSGTNVNIKVEVNAWYADPDPLSDIDSGIIDGLELIEKIPDSETGTQEDIDAWLAEQGLERPAADVTSDSDDAIQATYDPRVKQNAITVGATACIGAIILAVLSNIYLVSKLAKVKAAIKTVGGTKAAYKALRKAYKTYRKAGHGRGASAKKAFKHVFTHGSIGKDVRDALIDLATVGGVIEKCF